MKNEVSQTPKSAAAELHTTIATTAQQYLDSDTQTQRLDASLDNYAHEHWDRLQQSNTKDPEVADLRILQVRRQAALGALARIMSDKITEHALQHSVNEGLDIYSLLGNNSPQQAFTRGMADFLDKAVDEAIGDLDNSGHQYHALFRLYVEIENEYLPKVYRKNNDTRRGAVAKVVPTAYELLLSMFSSNYQHDAAAFLVAHGVAIQDEYDELPEPSLLAATTREARPHWLALTTVSRTAFGNIYFGRDHHKAILQAYKNGGRHHPTWSGTLPEGLIAAAQGIEQPFATCPMRSSLLFRRSGDVILLPSKSPARCAGQLALSLTPEANARAAELSYRIDGGIEESGAYAPAELIIDLARYASKLIYHDALCRQALIKAKAARNNINTSIPEC